MHYYIVEHSPFFFLSGPQLGNVQKDEMEISLDSIKCPLPGHFTEQ